MHNMHMIYKYRVRYLNLQEMSGQYKATPIIPQACPRVRLLPSNVTVFSDLRELKSNLILTSLLVINTLPLFVRSNPSKLDLRRSFLAEPEGGPEREVVIPLTLLLCCQQKMSNMYNMSYMQYMHIIFTICKICNIRQYTWF